MNVTLAQSCLRDLLLRRAASFSVGVRGVIAEFHWAARDAVVEDAGGCCVATGLGAIAVTLQGDEQVSEFAGGAGHAYWLPEPRARLDGEQGLRELGADAHAVRAGHRDQLLFDMGFDLGHVRACVRTAHGPLIDTLRGHQGENLLARGHPAMAAMKAASPHRVFMSARARIEVFQRIPSRTRKETTPTGPHTHVLPALLGTPDPQCASLPAGARPVLFVHPPVETGTHHP